MRRLSASINCKNAAVSQIDPATFVLIVITIGEGGAVCPDVKLRVINQRSTIVFWGDWSHQYVAIRNYNGNHVIEDVALGWVEQGCRGIDHRPLVGHRIINLRVGYSGSIFAASNKNPAIGHHVSRKQGPPEM